MSEKSNFERSHDFPSGVLVETTIRCPADCVICPNKKINTRPKDMSWSLFNKIVDDCQGKQVKEFCPFIHGEPLSWKYLEKGLDYLSLMLPDTGVVIYTNGYLLDSSKTKLLLRDNISEVHFSIDGLSKQVYEQHRRGLVYERVLANVIGFLAELHKSKRRIKTHVAFTVTPQNQHEVDAFHLFWEGLVDTVEIIPCDGRGGEERLPAFTDGRQLPCFQVTSHMYILTDGSAVPCCKDWAGYTIMGNMSEQSLESIWNSKEYRLFRTNINRGTAPAAEVCRRCLSDQL
jgi:radical SAM protein with 4Fe4S-binding SPASM domain